MFECQTDRRQIQGPTVGLGKGEMTPRFWLGCTENISLASF
jgi:hypothetical protein